MKKILMTVVMLLILVAISTAAYIYFSTKNAVDTMISTLPPPVTLKYKSFSNKMDGSIAINNVTMNTGTDSIDIGSIELRLDSALDYIDFEKKIKSGEILPKLQLRINHIYSELPKDNRTNDEKLPFELILNYINALGCGDIKEINTSQMAELGYAGLDTSLNIDFTYDKITSQAMMVAGMTMHGMGDISIKTSIPNIKTYFDFASAQNKLSNLDITIQDLGYNNNLIEFCSEKAQVEPEKYIDNHIQLLKKYLSKSNITLSDDLYGAYKSYFADHTPLQFISSPANALNLEYIDLYDVKDWPSILGLSIYNDGKKLDNIQFNWKKDSAVKSLLNARVLPEVKEDKVKQSQKANKLKTKARAAIPPAFVEIPTNQLNEHISSTVKIKSTMGKIYTGTVKKVTPSQLVIEVRLQGGKAAMPINIFQIEKAYIYQ